MAGPALPCIAWQKHPRTHPAQLAEEVLHFPVSFLQILFVKNSAAYHEKYPWNIIKGLHFLSINCWQRPANVFSRKSFFSTGFASNDVPFCNSKLNWENHFSCLKCDFSAG